MEASAARGPAERAMTSAINWSLLGVVISRPSYGSEFARRFQRIYGDVLWLKEQHVYDALDKLEARGFIEVIPGSRSGRQPRVRYRATPLGVRSYEDWVVQQIDVQQRQQELWVRQLAVFADDPVAALHVIGRFEREYQTIAGRPRHTPDGPTDSRSQLIAALVDEHRRIAVGGMLSWLRRTHERFETQAGNTGRGDAS
jgi:DNA-binding PadR family transcriptional regulator